MRGSRSRRLRTGAGGDDCDDTVSWLATTTPGDGDARLVYEAVVKAELTRYGDIVEYVADGLFTDDYARSGPATDIGMFRNWYRDLAREILHRLAGSATIAIRRHPPAIATRD
jgi:hypothetical protein